MLAAMSRGFLLFLLPVLAVAQEWTHYGGDAGAMKYSPLEQIDTRNVGELEVAWVYDVEDVSDGKTYASRSAFEATPLVIDGEMYVQTPFHRLVALDPETGEERWVFDTGYDPRTRVNLHTSRGVAYWTDGEAKRLYLGDQMGRLFSVDAKTGEPDEAFGESGMLDLREGAVADGREGRYGLTSPGCVCGDVFLIGGWVSDSLPQGPSGDIRAFDVRSGELVWTFHTVPRPGEFGHETWEGDSWKNRGGTNAWSVISADEEMGMAFVPLTSPSYDYYGGDRHGDNLFADSVVALDCETGKRRWHFQTVHHNVWDWDLPAHPSLVTVTRDGKQVPAVAQITKTGFVFVLDRLTGEPLFEVEERPVPASPVPGEQLSPTQPFPVLPPPFTRQSMRREELTDVTPESRAQCLALIEDADVEGPLFRPITDRWTVMFPGTNGGPNWGGGSFDPESQVLFVNSMDVGALFRLMERDEDASLPFRNRSARFGRFWDENQYPCQQPPWGSLTAIDLNSGTFRWRVTLGEFDELTAQGVPRTGTPNLGGSVVTKGGLVFIAATNDSRFRAFDKKTGEELWVTRLPASGHASPMTYLGAKTGKQFVVIAAGGGNKYNNVYDSKLIAFALPEHE